METAHRAAASKPRASPPDAPSSSLVHGIREVVAEGIDCTGYDVAELLVRVHDDATTATGATIEVGVLSGGRTLDDPARDFYTAPIGVVVLESNPRPAAGFFQVERIEPPLGSMLAVRVKGTRDATGGNIRARISVDLVLKTR